MLDSSGFSVWVMLVHHGNGWFVFQSGDDTDIWFDDDWNWFDWSVEECKVWFSVWDWQETDLVGCFRNCKISIPNVFAERILHLRHLKNGSTLLALMHLFIYFGDLFFTYPWTLWVDYCPHLLQFILLILFCFQLLVFLIIEDLVSGWFLLYMRHTQQDSINKSNQIKYLFLLQVYFGPINSTLCLHVKKLAIACNTCKERILVRLNLT